MLRLAATLSLIAYALMVMSLPIGLWAYVLCRLDPVFNIIP